MINVLKFAATTTVASGLGLSAHPVAAQNTIKLWNPSRRLPGDGSIEKFRP